MKTYHIRARLLSVWPDVYLVVKDNGRIGYTSKMAKATPFSQAELNMSFPTITRKFVEQHPKNVVKDIFYTSEVDQDAIDKQAIGLKIAMSRKWAKINHLSDK